MNIQDMPDAIMLTEYASISHTGTISRYVYCTKSRGMLYEVDPSDGTITGQRYILNISWDRIPADLKS